MKFHKSKPFKAIYGFVGVVFTISTAFYAAEIRAVFEALYLGFEFKEYFKLYQKSILMIVIVLVIFLLRAIIVNKKNIDLDNENQPFYQVRMFKTMEEYKDISPKLIGFISGVLGKELSATASLSAEQLELHAKKNMSSIIYMYLPQDKVQGGIAIKGVAIVCGITEDTVHDILTNVIKTGHQITSDNICKTFRSSAGIYIIGVYANSQFAQGKLLSVIENYLCKQILTDKPIQKIKYIFSRGSTSYGLKSLLSHGFQEVTTDSSILKLPTSKAMSLCQQLSLSHPHAHKQTNRKLKLKN